MKPAILALPVFALYFAASSLGQERRKPAASISRYVQHPLQAILRTPVVHVSWDGVPFGDVIEWIRSKSDKNNPFNVIPRWRALETAGVDKKTSVTLELAEVTVAQVLDEVLGQISGPDPLLYVSRGNTLRITTKSNLRRRIYTRTYDVAEVVMRSRGMKVQPQFFSGRQLDFGAATATPGAGIGSSNQTLSIGATLFGDPAENDDDQDDATDDELAQNIMDAIVTTVAPESWRVNGGLGSMSFVDGVLIVRNSADVHEMIGGSFQLRD